MKIVLTIAGLGGEFGGPSRSVPALAAALGRLGADVELVTTMPAIADGPALLPPANLVLSHLVPTAPQWSAGRNAFAAVVRARCAGHDDAVVHDQGLWLPSNHAVAAAARELGTPRIVSPRGMLSSWALAAKGLKKKLAWSLYHRGDLMRASALHVTSQSEVDDCRRTGYRGPITVVVNGTELPPQTPSDRADAAASRPGIRTVLYLGRVHPVKGLSTLLDAWARLRPEQWRLLIAGGGGNGHVAALRRQIEHEGLGDRVELVGHVEGEGKWALYKSADLFVLPSLSENFGMVVAEALASGVPVVTTQATPWSELAAQACGWWVESGLVALTDALRAALATSPAELRAMGERGRRLVESKYTWEVAAREMLSLYESAVRRRRDGRNA
jgi:glycosyltransferase involved in cell wall biosynthesis